jgi:hypothetical protein
VLSRNEDVAGSTPVTGSVSVCYFAWEVTFGLRVMGDTFG